jgi:hypothetical protein
MAAAAADLRRSCRDNDPAEDMRGRSVLITAVAKRTRTVFRLYFAVADR